MIGVFEEIDAKAETIAKLYCKKKAITHEIACIIIDLYKSESVHRRYYKTTYEGYKDNFRKNTALPKDIFFILSNDLYLDLAWKDIYIDKGKLTDDFEKMLDRYTG